MSKTEEYCPLGYYCPEGSEMPIPCPAGHYCPVVNDTGVPRGKLVISTLEKYCVNSLIQFP